MRSRQFTKALAILFTVTLIAPSALLVKPQPAYAQAPGLEVPTGDWITRIKETLNLMTSYTNTAANVAMQIDAYVLQPLAFVLSGNLMKALTAGVIQFVIGKANGTGAPQFAVDVMKSLQTVSDSQALAYINSFGRNSNSPFSYSISSALRTNYLSKTSLAGFWAANMNTLARSSPNQNAFLSGRWTQGGGVAAWFALTTRTENNPYTLYQASQSQMSTLIGPGVGGATGARVAQLDWGQGFMSWCGATEMTTTEDNDGTGMEGVNPGDACTNKDGTPGTIKTPGSVIKATLDKVLGGQQDQIVRMGNVGPQINQILGNIATVMKTASFAAELLGGSDSGGLFGVAQTSGSNSTSRLMQYQNTPGSLGVTNASVYQNAATLTISGTDMLNRVAQYESAWNTIRTAANAASTTVADLATYCIAEQKVAPTILSDGSTQDLANFLRDSTAQAAAARSALTNVIAPVLAQAAAAASTSAATRAMVQKIQNEANASTEEGTNAYLADLQSLQTMRPTDTDLSSVLQDSTAVGRALAIPTGSLNVTGGTLVDQMSLVGTNAAALKASVCTPTATPPSANSGGDFGGV